MTTGNKTVDLRYPISGSPTEYQGLFSYRSWSGADSSPSYPQPRNRYFPSGDSSTKIEDFFPLWDREPKRARAYAEHNYAATGRRFGAFPFGFNTVPHNYVVWSTHKGVSVMPMPSDPWTSNDDLKLQAKLIDKLSGMSFNLSVSLAEVDKTLAMIADIAHRLSRVLYYARRGNLRSASLALLPRGKKAVLSSSARSWLEVQYGIKPLLRDVYSGAAFLAHHLNTPGTVTVRVGRALRLPATTTNLYDVADCRTTTVRKKFLKAIVLEKDVAKLAGLIDPASLVWERLSFSFVADWFIPIQTWLDLRGKASGLTGTFVTSSVFKVKHEGPLTPRAGYVIDPSNNAGSMWHEDWDFSRTVGSSLTIPFPELKTLGQAASWQHCANAIALLVALGTKSKVKY